MLEQENKLTTEQETLKVILNPVQGHFGLNSASVAEGEFLIGSAAHCDYRIENQGVAEEHCKIFLYPDKAALLAIDSQTFINDDCVKHSQLRKGDRLAVGPVLFSIDVIQPNEDADAVSEKTPIVQAVEQAISQELLEPATLTELLPAPADSAEKAVDELACSLRQTQELQAQFKQQADETEKVAQQDLAQEQARSESLQQNIDQLQDQLQKLCEKLEQPHPQQEEIDEQYLNLAADKELLEARREELDAEKAVFSQARKDIQEIREQVEQEEQKVQQQRDELQRERTEFEELQNGQPQAEITVIEEANVEEVAVEEPSKADQSDELQGDDAPLDLDFGMLGDLMNQSGTEDVSAASSNETKEPVSEPIAEEKESIDLHSELAHMFGMDETQSHSESDQTVDAPQQKTELNTDLDSHEEVQIEESDVVKETTKEVIEESAADPVAVEDADDQDSIAAYMKDLFARTNGNQDYIEPTLPKKAAPKKQEQSIIEEKMAVEPIQPVSELETGQEDVPVDNTPQEPPAPVAKIDKDALALKIASLREIANQTARNALSSHAWKQLRVKIFINATLSVIGGIVSAVLLTAPLWCQQSYLNYGIITLVITAVTSIELIRSNMLLARYKIGQRTAKKETAELEDEEIQQ